MIKDGDGRVLYATAKWQEELHSDPARFRAAIGGRGSGKSIFLLGEGVWKYIVPFAGCHVLLLRKDFKELSKGLIQDLRTEIPAELYKYNASDHIATFWNGSLLFFGHCENLQTSDLNQYLSSSFSFIGLDEGGEFPFKVWDFLQGSNRNRVQGPKPTMALATNPYGIGYGWIKSLFIDKQPIVEMGKNPNYDPADYAFRHSTADDNPFLKEKDPDYLNRLNLLSPGLRQRMLYGDLNSLSGSYYSTFSRDAHVIDLGTDQARVMWQPWQPCWSGIDWGIAHFTVVLWFTRALVRQMDGTRKLAVVCYREMAFNETDIDAAAKVVKEGFNGYPAYPNGPDELKRMQHTFISHELFARRSSPRPDQTVAAELSRAFRALGLPECTKAAGSASHQERIDGATLIRNSFATGDLFITSNCTELIRAIPLLARDEKELEDVAKTSGIEDDLFDALKHGTLSVLGPMTRPKEDIVREIGETIPDKLMRWQYLTKNLPKSGSMVRVHREVRMPWEMG
jgi:phage terminase large subunit